LSSLNQEQYIEFKICQERYSIHIRDIQEIIKIQEVTEIPTNRSYVKGVINLRGKVVPIISLRIFFGWPAEANTRSTRVIIVKHKEESIGIIVDQVNRVTTFKDIQLPPEHLESGLGRCFVGIGFTEQGLVNILKLDEVLL
jgi:purine-binding chemotaxis protein CheW